MSVTIKSAHEIELMREAGRLLNIVHKELEAAIRPGISTWELDKLGERVIRGFGCVPNFLNYNGFPASFCISVNDEVVHGIPSKEKILHEGDIVSIDNGASYEGYHGDSARTFAVGTISPEAKRLIAVTKQSFFEGLKKAVSGNRVFDISSGVQQYVEAIGFSVVRALVGHGVGADLHESPEVPNFGTAGRGARLVPGMTLAIEPMVNMGAYHVNTLSDGWTVVTADGSLSAHYENSVLITGGEPEILTKC